MRNITIAVSDVVYHKARVWAAEHDTSISAVVAFLIEQLPNRPLAADRFPKPDSASKQLEARS